jgi:hypothetical protein
LDDTSGDPVARQVVFAVSQMARMRRGLMASKSTTFERMVRSYINMTGASYADIAITASVHPSQISKFMKGERGLNSPSLGRILDALGCQLLPPTMRFKPVTVGRPKLFPVEIKGDRGGTTIVPSESEKTTDSHSG